MNTHYHSLFTNKRIPFKKKSIAVALLFIGSSTISHAVEWEKEFVIESDVSWNEMVGGGGQAIHPNQKVTILNESTIRFDYKNELVLAETLSYTVSTCRNLLMNIIQDKYLLLADTLAQLGVNKLQHTA